MYARTRQSHGPPVISALARSLCPARRDVAICADTRASAGDPCSRPNPPYAADPDPQVRTVLWARVHSPCLTDPRLPAKRRPVWPAAWAVASAGAWAVAWAGAWAVAWVPVLAEALPAAWVRV